jgi:iron complex outermembrane receptor protein
MFNGRPFNQRLIALAVATTSAGVSIAQAQPVEEMVIIGVRDTHTVRTDDTMVAPADTAELLKEMPGANVNRNGELTGIPQYRGMHGQRVNVSINGSHISSGGPNAMDTPLHYAPVAVLESLTIRRGIAPVSAGQETIGGQMNAVTYHGEYGTSNEYELGGRLYVGGQTVNDGGVGSLFLSLANRNQIFRGMVMREEASDSEFADGTIRPSSYDRDRYDLGFSTRHGDHEFTFDFSRNDTNDAGTVALAMDIEAVDTDMFNASHTWDTSDFRLSTKVSYNDVMHLMSNFHMRVPPQDKSRYRRTLAEGSNTHFVVDLELPTASGSWKFGVDGNFEDHNATIGNPNAAAFEINSFSDITRDILGLYIERSQSLTDDIGLDAGVRFNRVTMNSGPISANLNPMNASSGMPLMMNNMAEMLAMQFNNSDLKQRDYNTDWFARLSIDSSRDLIWYVGAAQKMRAPSYQERYLWMPLGITAGLADGNLYVGNPNLKPEVSHEIEIGFDLDAGPFSLYPRLFARNVKDYIQGTPSTNMLANNFAQMMANMGMGQPDPLQWNNVEARFRGMDMEASFRINSTWQLRAVGSIIEGERRDIDDDLYRISPDNIMLALDYTGNQWTGSVETVRYSHQERVSTTNKEQETDGYTLVNLSASYRPTNTSELGLGVNNLLDKNYENHLGGYNRAVNPDIAPGARVPGLGRSFYGRLMWYF